VPHSLPLRRRPCLQPRRQPLAQPLQRCLLPRLQLLQSLLPLTLAPGLLRHCPGLFLGSGLGLQPAGPLGTPQHPLLLLLLACRRRLGLTLLPALRSGGGGLGLGALLGLALELALRLQHLRAGGRITC